MLFTHSSTAGRKPELSSTPKTREAGHGAHPSKSTSQPRRRHTQPAALARHAPATPASQGADSEPAGITGTRPVVLHPPPPHASEATLPTATAETSELGSHALPIIDDHLPSSDDGEADTTARVAAKQSTLEHSHRHSVPYKQPAIHARGYVKVPRGSNSSSGLRSSLPGRGGHDLGSSSSSRIWAGTASTEGKPTGVAVAGSAVGSSRAKAAQAKAAKTGGAPAQSDLKQSNLDKATAAGKQGIGSVSWSALSKLALLVSMLASVPAAWWFAQSATTAASLLSTLGTWTPDGLKLAPIHSAGSALTGPGSGSAPLHLTPTSFAASSMGSHAQHVGDLGSAQQQQRSSTSGLSSGFGMHSSSVLQSGATSTARDVAARASSAGDAGALTMPYLPTIPPASVQQWDPDSTVRVAVIVGGTNNPSPYGGAPWGEVMAHTAQRLQWTDGTFEMLVFDEKELGSGASGEGASALTSALKDGCQILLGIGVTDSSVVSMLQQQQGKDQGGLLPDVRLFFNSPPELQDRSTLKGWAPWGKRNPVTNTLQNLVPWSGPAKTAVLWDSLQNLWQRKSSDDLLYVFLVLINEYVTPVREVYMTTKGTDLESLWCMVTKCGDQIRDCISNPVCKSGLDCLQACQFNDQICQYRCIVAHETPTFEQFALCILQKHNCRGLSAQAPTEPDHGPMSMFQGRPMTHEAAEDILFGWIEPHRGNKPFSWLVAAGKNPAYDYFPCQHQLFTRGKGKGQMWYEPVFKVVLDGAKEVWRRRKYRVRRATTPGTFFFTVLDNGVVSKEFWRILDCDEAMEWVLLGYTGAASTAGLSYSGAVVGTRDGSYPTAPDALQRLEAAMGRAGIRPWELSFVDNSRCAGAPL